MNYLNVKKFQSRQSFGITPMLLEVALEGERGSGRRRKGRARNKQTGDGVQGVHIRREGNLMGNVNEEQRNLAQVHGPLGEVGRR